ncbi:UNVERIFIED_CONTAM: hypothetical protein Sangu_1037500, partial [Sesamum angustifolium]
LRNDHKDITEKINQNIQLLHSATLAPRSASVKDSEPKDRDANVGMPSSFSNPIAGGASSAMNVDLVVSRPFAMVDEITEASPAAEDGLQLGDQIVKFGNVEIGENLLQRLAAEAQQKQGQAVSLVVMRQGALINMIVTPRAWSGVISDSYDHMMAYFIYCCLKYLGLMLQKRSTPKLATNHMHRNAGLEMRLSEFCLAMSQDRSQTLAGLFWVNLVGGPIKYSFQTAWVDLG